MWREQALARWADPHPVEHLSRLWQVFANPAYRDDRLVQVTGAIEEVTGAPPETLPEYLQANRATVLGSAG